MVAILERTRYFLKHCIWIINGFIGKQISVDPPEKVTVLITYYHPLRLKDINNQIRNILKCDFVEKLVLSNHNPEIKIEEKVVINDKRILCINQSKRRGCGYRWHIARTIPAKYLISLDDDILIFPSQLKTLSQSLFNDPGVPHGFSGFICNEKEELQFRECENIDVNFLCEIYAVSMKHIERYIELENFISKNDSTLTDIIERYHDFIIISKSGTNCPKIHKTSRIFRNNSFKTPGIAIHKEKLWSTSIFDVIRAVNGINDYV